MGNRKNHRHFKKHEVPGNNQINLYPKKQKNKRATQDAGKH